ncbi:uncharacterized protein DC041_0006334, partial [Schistosoma bovis]
IVGLALAVLGGLMTFSRSATTRTFGEIWGRYLEKMNVSNSSIEQTIADATLKMSGHYSRPIFAIGLIILIICIAGILGSCCKSSLCLKIVIHYSHFYHHYYTYHYIDRLFCKKTSHTDLKYPLPCCQFKDNLEIQGNTCPNSFRNSNVHNGCLKPLHQLLTYYVDIAAYISFILLLCEFNILYWGMTDSIIQGLPTSIPKVSLYIINVLKPYI